MTGYSRVFKRLEDGQVSMNGASMPITSEEITSGCSNNNYRVELPNAEVGYIKTVHGFSDYAEVVCKEICDEVGLPCADVELVGMETFGNAPPQTYDEYARDMQARNWPYSPEQYNRYLKLNPAVRPGILSKDIMSSGQYVQMGSFENIGESINLENVTDMVSSIKANFQPGENFPPDTKISDDFESVQKKYTLFAYMTANDDLAPRNMNYVVEKTNEGHVLKHAPLFDNGEAFGSGKIERLDEMDRFDALYIVNENKENGVYIPITGNSQENSEEQNLEDMATMIVSDPEMSDFFTKLSNVNISQICEGLPACENSRFFNEIVCETFLDRRDKLMEKVSELTQAIARDNQIVAQDNQIKGTPEVRQINKEELAEVQRLISGGEMEESMPNADDSVQVKFGKDEILESFEESVSAKDFKTIAEQTKSQLKQLEMQVEEDRKMQAQSLGQGEL